MKASHPTWITIALFIAFTAGAFASGSSPWRPPRPKKPKTPAAVELPGGDIINLR
jgi:hypothetical protein